MPSLVYKYEHDPYETAYFIDKEITRVGRLPSNDLPILDASVSRNHFVITREGGGYFISDDGSSNGTLLNDGKLDGRVRLHDLDRIQAGNVLFTFKEDELTTIHEVVHEKLASIAASPSYLKNAYFDAILSVARESIYTTDYDRFYRDTITLICEAVKAQYGAIVFFDEKDDRLLLKAANDDNGPGIAGISSAILNRSVKGRAGLIVRNTVTDNRFTGDLTIKDMGISSAVCAPIWENEYVYGAIYADRRTNPVPFTEDHLNFMTVIANLLALNIAHERLIQRVSDERNVAEQIKRFVPIEAVSGLLDMIKNSPSSLWKVQKAETTTVVFADIVGFTALTEKNDADTVAKLLRAFFEKATDTVLSNGGSINKFLGDGFMAVFGTPVPHPDDVDRAIRSARALLEWVKHETGGIPFSLRIGMDTGPVTGIMVGSTQRLEYTIIGNCVNVASRLQAKADVNQILISGETNRFIQAPVNTRPIGEISVKGKEKPLLVYEVVP